MFTLIASKEIECKLGKLWWMDRQPKEVQYSVGFLLPSRSIHCVTQLIKMHSAYFSRLKSIVTWDSLLFYSSWLYWVITLPSAVQQLSEYCTTQLTYLLLVCWIFTLIYLPETGGAEGCSLICFLEGYVGHSFTGGNFHFCAWYKVFTLMESHSLSLQ